MFAQATSISFLFFFGGVGGPMAVYARFVKQLTVNPTEKACRCVFGPPRTRFCCVNTFLVIFVFLVSGVPVFGPTVFQIIIDVHLMMNITTVLNKASYTPS